MRDQRGVDVGAAQARQRSIEWARAAMLDPTTVFLDTETTGLDGRAEIVDIGVVDIHGEVLLDTLVRPVRGIPWGASRIHGILDHHVRDAPSWTDIHPRLMPLLLGRRVVIFNARYDQRMIEQCCAQFRLDAFPCEWECAMLAYAGFVGELNASGRGYRWHKLEKAATAFGIRPGGHRACADAEACRQVVHRMALS